MNTPANKSLVVLRGCFVFKWFVEQMNAVLQFLHCYFSIFKPLTLGGYDRFWGVGYEGFAG